jgi:hypothetical protein
MSVAQPQLEPFDEVRSMVDEAIADAGAEYHTGVLAVELRERIRVDRPDLWDVWVDLMAVDALKTAIGRTRALTRRPRSTFRRGSYDLTEEVDSSHTQRRFGDMTRPDLDFVARSYAKRASTMSSRAKAIRALRDRLPDDTTRLRDVVPEDDVGAIFT